MTGGPDGRGSAAAGEDGDQGRENQSRPAMRPREARGEDHRTRVRRRRPDCDIWAADRAKNGGCPAGSRRPVARSAAAGASGAVRHHAREEIAFQPRRACGRRGSDDGVSEVWSVHLALHNANPDPLVEGPTLVLASVHSKACRRLTRPFPQYPAPFRPPFRGYFRWALGGPYSGIARRRTNPMTRVFTSAGTPAEPARGSSGS